MSITSIRLRNFRGFSDVTLPLKPLTVLLGPNSSGKSSFGHALAVTSHCQRRNMGGRATLTPHGNAEEWPVDLGMLSDLRAIGTSDRVYIGFEAHNRWVHFGFGDPNAPSQDLSLSFIAHPYPQVGSMSQLAGQGTEKPIEGAVSDVIRVAQLPPEAAEMLLTRQSQTTWWDQVTNRQLTVELDGLLIRAIQPLGTTVALAPDQDLQRELRRLFETLTYIRAIRKRPLRTYQDGVGPWQPIGYEGEWAPTVLLENEERTISIPIPADPPTSLETAKSILDLAWKEWKGTLANAVSLWLGQLGLGTSVEAARPGEDKRRVEVRVTVSGRKSHNITEIGFGISQVLPILVAGLLQPEDSLLLIDLPEAHLHPWPQARLADFFCSLAYSNRNVVIETHSDVLFHWLRLRAELDRRLADKIGVYFFDRSIDDCCQSPTLVELTGSAQLRWPLGFFEEAWNIETYSRLAREARGAQT